jgi:hypothetical protein
MEITTSILMDSYDLNSHIMANVMQATLAERRHVQEAAELKTYKSTADGIINTTVQ